MNISKRDSVASILQSEPASPMNAKLKAEDK